MVELDKPQITRPCTLHAATWDCRHILTTCNTPCFSTATMVMQMCFNVTIYVHCPFCSNFGPTRNMISPTNHSGTLVWVSLTSNGCLIKQHFPLFMLHTIDWLIDMHWVRVLVVPMHLCLVDGPFMCHNLISAQDSPVPLPKYLMAPRLKTWMSSGSKKGNQIHFPFLLKSPSSESPPGSPVGPLWRAIPVIREFLHISWYISLSQRP